jgi:hypothetical protein
LIHRFREIVGRKLYFRRLTTTSRPVATEFLTNKKEVYLLDDCLFVSPALYKLIVDADDLDELTSILDVLRPIHVRNLPVFEAEDLMKEILAKVVDKQFNLV